MVQRRAALRSNYFDAEQIVAIVQDYRHADLETAEVALIAFAEKITLHAYKITQRDIDELRAHGFSDADVLDIILATASRVFYSKVMDAVGLEPSPEWVKGVKSLLGERLFESLMVGRPFGGTDSDSN